MNYYITVIVIIIAAIICVMKCTSRALLVTGRADMYVLPVRYEHEAIPVTDRGGKYAFFL
jgi:hypothetical protein